MSEEILEDHGETERIRIGGELILRTLTRRKKIVDDDLPKIARAYAEFRAEYDRYWRRFFDPIALRVQITPSLQRIETTGVRSAMNAVLLGASFPAKTFTDVGPAVSWLLSQRGQPSDLVSAERDVVSTIEGML